MFNLRETNPLKLSLEIATDAGGLDLRVWGQSCYFELSVLDVDGGLTVTHGEMTLDKLVGYGDSVYNYFEQNVHSHPYTVHTKSGFIKLELDEYGDAEIQIQEKRRDGSVVLNTGKTEAVELFSMLHFAWRYAGYFGLIETPKG